MTIETQLGLGDIDLKLYHIIVWYICSDDIKRVPFNAVFHISMQSTSRANADVKKLTMTQQVHDLHIF